MMLRRPSARVGSLKSRRHAFRRFQPYLTFSLPTDTAGPVMPETTVNPVIESALWAYQVSPLLSPTIFQKSDTSILPGKGQ
jgi:hypothetical protein